MIGWKNMYLTMVRESEKALRILEGSPSQAEVERAVDILIQAQRRCEDLYIESGTQVKKALAKKLV